ncbi:MAG: hypothetical protein KKB37_11900 [Alphaproteobacteria bacterium]|nr:hypothetical protein [Alphaproteobacteria bacterium]
MGLQISYRDCYDQWRWQRRYLDEGIEGLKRDKPPPPGTPPFSEQIKAKVLAKTATQTLTNAAHGPVRSTANVVGIPIIASNFLS